MSNSPSGSKASILNAEPITENADDVPDSTANNNSNSNSIRDETSLRSSDSKEGRKSISDSKGRKSSHRRGSGHRRRTKHSPMRSSSRSDEGSYAGGGSSELLYGDDGDGEAKPRSSRTSRSSRTARTSRTSPKRDKRSISPKNFYDDGEDTKHSAKASERSPTRSKGSVNTRHGRPSAALLSPSGQNKGSVSTARSSALLYGNEEDAKIKAKSLSPKRSSKPGVQHLSPSGQSRSTVSTSRSDELLYGHDEDAKAKAKAKSSRSPKRSPKPGVEVVSLSGETRSTVSSARSTEVLYGDEDAKAKAKASSRSPKRSHKPGIQLVHENVSPSGQSRSTFSSTQSTEILYGMSDKDSKAKAKAISGSSSKRSTDTNNTATEILYGNEADAKIKSKSSGNNQISRNPGVEEVAESRSIAVSSIPIEEAEEDSSLPFKVEGAVVQEGKSKKRKSGKEKQAFYTKWIILAFVIVLIGGGTTAFIALHEDEDNQGTHNQDADYIQDPTEAPKAPAGSPNHSTPTAPAPSNNLARDPPSAEECAAITKNSTNIPGNITTVNPNNWNVNIQINVKGETGMTDDMVQELLDSIQELLLPSMAGCSVDQRKLMDMARPVIRGAPRGLEVVFDDARFAILFAYVKGEVQADAICVNTPTPDLCYIVLVEFVVYLDSVISSAEVEDVLLEELLDGNDIVSKLNLGDSFASANATNVTDVTPSEVPSSSPTDTPSASPSMSRSPTESPTVPSTTNGPDGPAVGPVSEPTDAPDTSTLDPVAKPTLGPATPTSIPLDGPTSVPIESSPPSAMPTNVSSTSPSETPSTSPSSSPTSMPVLGPSPPPTVSPTVLASSAPTTKPTIAPSSAPTVRTTDVPSTTPTEKPTVSSSSPSIPLASSAPSGVPSRSPSTYPSPVPSPSPSRSITFYPTSAEPFSDSGSLSPTQCSCLQWVPNVASGGSDGTEWTTVAVANACDGSEATMEIGCGSCIGSNSCTGLRDGSVSLETSVIQENSCRQFGACDYAKVDHIGGTSCIGDYACQGRHIDAGSFSCKLAYACAVDLDFESTYGKLVAGERSCHGQYACYSKEIVVESNSCIRDWACAGRPKMYVADMACTGFHACSASGSGPVGANSAPAVQTETSYFGAGSCTCENCCVCMVRVIPGRCTRLGECCDADDPTLKAADVVDNTEEEMKQAFGTTELDYLFPWH